jgi:gamma-glutamyltranspeptidase
VLDARYPAAVLAGLERRGHRVAATTARPGAGAGGILINAQTGQLHGGDDPFGEGIAAGCD